MNKKRYMYLCCLLLIGLFLHSITDFSAERDIVTTWEYHYTPEETGFSSEKLQIAKDYFDSINSTAAIAVYNGKVLFEWGDVSKNTNAHSIRKSFLSALYGIQIENGLIDLDNTLNDLSIDDHPKLTELEKTATIEDLITSRSGVFHKAGEESWTMRRSRPQRGSHLPGTYFYYNNWDFNVLGTIYNNQTSSDLFQDFEKMIAQPLGMEDFSLQNTQYKEESRRSIHPSYLFQISARDMARFGQLILQEGKWGDEQIIPKKWIQLSTNVHANVPHNNIYDYGYMWWVATDGEFGETGLISAIGRYGQSIDIIPSKNLVFVHRVDSNQPTLGFIQRNVTQRERLKLLEHILDAKNPPNVVPNNL